MGMFSTMKLDDLKDLLHEQLADLYDAEKRICKALPKMSNAASSPELKQAFDRHLAETEAQVQRLESVFEELGSKAERETCEAMKGLINEGEEMIDAKGDSSVKDAALIAAAQRVEHYEIAAYGSVRALAQKLGHEHAAQLLQESLDEEGDADKQLTAIAESLYATSAPARA